ncbi:MAG TPA: TIGR03088 family PEP-CTERM/XrtA system glycosyltransferase [Candidatus Eisenbacteria bacterium]|nr:TIGR03088 family PEP-CTERM/XrtA system glycosyltransferase [Candidatus Eisenbacteria bacterium]
MTDAAPPLILHVIHHLRMGGMENGLVNLINRMPPTRYRHAIACVEDSSEFERRIERPGVAVHSLHRSRIGVWGLQRELFSLCRKIRPAILHSRNQSGLDALLPARMAGVRRRIHGEHGWDVGDIHGTKWKPALLRRVHAPLVDRYVTVSKDLERYLIERIGIAPRRITQIYNGVDTERFAPVPRPDRDRLPEAFRAEGLVLVGLVGRLQPVKDFASMIRALGVLRERAPRAEAAVRVAVFGDGPLLGDLRGLVASLALESRVWFAGSVPDVPDALRSMDLFALTSRNEGISNTILEAMAVGLPVLATAVGGNVELVQDGVTGTLVPAGDPESLAGAVAAYASDPALRRAHGEAGRARAVERFSLAAMVRRYLDLYDAELGSAPSGERRQEDESGFVPA